MATNRRRRTRQVFTELSEDQLAHLLTGNCLDDCQNEFYRAHGDPGFPFLSEEHRRETYFRQRDYLLSLTGKGKIGLFFGKLKPGERPKAFHDYEASQPSRPG
jgi:hypothetical protein